MNILSKNLHKQLLYTPVAKPGDVIPRLDRGTRKVLDNIGNNQASPVRHIESSRRKAQSDDAG